MMIEILGAALVVMIIVTFLCAILCGVVAQAKGRGGGSWFLAGLFTGVLGLIAIAGMPGSGTDRRRRATPASRQNGMAQNVLTAARCPNSARRVRSAGFSWAQTGLWTGDRDPDTYL
jgi:hypothetical protein